MQITLSVARSKREFYDYDNPRSFAPGPRTKGGFVYYALSIDGTELPSTKGYADRSEFSRILSSESRTANGLRFTRDLLKALPDNSFRVEENPNLIPSEETRDNMSDSELDRLIEALTR